MKTRKKIAKIDALESGISSLGRMVASAGLSPQTVLAGYQADLKNTPDPSRALTNFLRYLESGFSSKLLRDFSDQRFLQQIILELFAQSQYLADIMIRDPELFAWLTLGGALKQARGREDLLREARAVMEPFGRVEKQLDALKRFHRRQILRLGAREILKEADIDAITAELSSLAEAVIQAVLELSDAGLRAATGYDGPNTLAVVGLGKLGGCELNFSSDVDLMFVYEGEGEFHAPQERIHSLHEYYSRLSELLLRRITESTHEGHLYRVDMRLRPDGNVGPIAMSRVSYRHYYESRGELWERQMLTKARVVAGNQETGEKFRSDIRPFVYPRTHLEDPRRVIYGIKRKIELKVQVIENVKLGSGGIRDIEFIVQALQLLYGGVRPELDSTGTLQTLQHVWKADLIGDGDVKDLSQGYQFLRMVEHRLQLLMGRQTHALPQSVEEIFLLAKRLGYPSTAAFRRELDRHRSNVRRIFDRFFLEEEVEGVRTVVQEPTFGVQDTSLLAFEEYDDALRHTRIVKEELSIGEDDEILSTMLTLLKSQRAPDWGLRNFMALSSTKLIKRSLLYAMGHPKVFELILLICSRSSAMTMTLVEEPLLFETLIGQPDEFFREGVSFEYLRKSDIRRYKVFNEFKLLLRFLLGEITIRTLTRGLSELASDVLSEIYAELVGERSRRNLSSNLCFIGLGSLGGKEMTFRSDADGVFVVGIPTVRDEARETERIARDFMTKMDQIGIYAVDLRLRPEGKSSPIMSDSDYLYQYLTARASLWERQTLTKARFVFGDRDLWKQLNEMIEQWVYAVPLPPGWISEARSMRNRLAATRSRARDHNADLKVDRGGIVDIEYVAQIMQLKHGGEKTNLRNPNTFELIEILTASGLSPDVDFPRLLENLEFLRRLETTVKINAETGGYVLPGSGPAAAAVAAGMGFSTTDELKRTIDRIRDENRMMYDAVITSLENGRVD
ncbi:MAG: hypothetical protein FJ215_01935 [Ignavibacteria bacterium]|nr:hypothetical protein [Ignavibacteria bacterium]